MYDNYAFMARCLIFLLAWAVSVAGQTRDVVRRDFFVVEEPGLRLFVREVIASPAAKHAPSILLIHGARVPSVASFDLDVPGGSLAADLATRGFVVYLMDVRGYGNSTRPEQMAVPPQTGPALVRTNEVADDIGAVIRWICAHRHETRVALFGWATGGQWAGYYASTHPEKVSALILLNSLYGGSSVHPLMGPGSDSEDPQHPGDFNRAACGTYRFNDEKSLFGVWDRNIPVPAKDSWRHPAVARAYAAAAIASDSTSGSRTPPSFRSPCGALEDSFYLASGRQLWDASLITAPTLILASENDFWSRPQDRELLARHLTHSQRVKVVVLKGATHFVHLERPERGRAELLDTVTEFLKTQ